MMPNQGQTTFLRLYSPKGWALIAAGAFTAFVLFPLLNLVVPPTSPFHLSAFWVTLAGKIMCYAIVALALDLLWGYAGILSLGHGLFFALGGYGMGMYLMRQIGREGQYQSTSSASSASASLRPRRAWRFSRSRRWFSWPRCSSPDGS
jgi:urea transport system permease protein